MAKADITTSDGLHVKLEGTPEEIAAVLKHSGFKPHSAKGLTKTATPPRGRTTIPSLVEELKQEGFFKQSKTLGSIKKRLADLGHNYPVTTLSGAMQAQAKRRNLRRFKEKGQYVYAQ